MLRIATISFILASTNFTSAQILPAVTETPTTIVDTGCDHSHICCQVGCECCGTPRETRKKHRQQKRRNRKYRRELRKSDKQKFKEKQ